MTAALLSREQLERAQNDVKTPDRQPSRAAEQGIRTQEQRIKQEEANLASAQIRPAQSPKVSPRSPASSPSAMIEEGETAVVGTMNNAARFC